MAERIPPYVRRHLASHAAAGQVLDSVIDAETLPWLDHHRLAELMRLTQPEPNSSEWVLLGAWRSVKHRWSWDDPVANAAALDLAIMAAGLTPPVRRHRGYGWAPTWAEWPTGGTVVGSGERNNKPTAAIGTVAGKQVVFGARGPELWVWEAATGNPLSEPIINSEEIEAMAAADDVVVCLARDGHVRIWNPALRHQELHLQLPGGVFRSIALGRLDNELVFVTGGGGQLVHVAAVASGETVRSLMSPDTIRGVAMHGSLVAAGHSNGAVLVWDVKSDALVHHVELDVEVNAVALGSDVRLGPVVSAGTSAPDVRSWSVGDEHSQYLWKFPPGDEVRAVALGLVAGETLLAASSLMGEVLVGSPQSYSPTALPHPMGVTAVEFGDVDGRPLLVTTCQDGNTRLWDPVQPSSVRHTGARVGEVTLIDRPDGVHVLGGLVDMVAHWRPDGTRTDLDLQLPQRHWAAAKTLSQPSVVVQAGEHRGSPVLVTVHDGTADLWRIDLDADGAVLLNSVVVRAPYYVRPDVFIGEDRVLVAWLDDDIVQMVDAGTQEEWALHPSLVGNAYGFGFLDAGDAVWYAVSDGSSMELIDVRSRSQVGRTLHTSSWPRSGLGTLRHELALAIIGELSVEIVDPLTGSKIGADIELPTPAFAVAWAGSAGAEVLLTTHHSTVRVWSPRTGRKVAELPFGTAIDAVATHTTPSGGVYVAVSGPGVVMTRLLPPPAPDLSSETDPVAAPLRG